MSMSIFGFGKSATTGKSSLIFATIAGQIILSSAELDIPVSHLRAASTASYASCLRFASALFTSSVILSIVSGRRESRADRACAAERRAGSAAARPERGDLENAAIS